MRAREFLNMLKWHPEYNIKGYTIVYIHRGARGDEKRVATDEVVELQHSYFVLETAKIPYHRIIKILDKNGKTVWRKP